ncbi:hypothetical protein K2224_17130 [Streptomyces sp. BHT-5-2]|uniref:hypothetical protein n=1 Tax=Streptomyces sp. BHT-5-2 TaxID=2866715 RepID=UPI001C8D9626|nr:hypothetical protein [Streptomyces sp. BHT-5-2]QZL04659.1 hypothetical protein K2224_17130 [Streptomyces sp. BHT-5-2]
MRELALICWATAGSVTCSPASSITGDALDRIEDVDGGCQGGEGIRCGAHRTVAVMWQSGECSIGIAAAAPLAPICTGASTTSRVLTRPGASSRSICGFVP